MTRTLFAGMFFLSIPGIMIAQVEVGKPIHLTGSDGNRSIQFLEAPVNGTDAVNKDYVDNAVSAGGGGTGVPSMISTESSTAFTYGGAVNYCDNLSEGGFTDWRLPDDKELRYFTSIPGASSNYLWTMSRSSIDYSANQNYISVKLDDGSWRNGDEMLMPSNSRVQTSSTTNTTPWVVTASIVPTVSGNWLKLTQISIQARSGYDRIKYYFPNGTTAYSPTYTSTSSSSLQVVLDWTNTVTPILVTQVDIESYSNGNTTYSHYSILSTTGFEIVPFQKAGATLYARCVR